MKKRKGRYTLLNFKRLPNIIIKDRSFIVWELTIKKKYFFGLYRLFKTKIVSYSSTGLYIQDYFRSISGWRGKVGLTFDIIEDVLFDHTCSFYTDH